MTRHPLPVTCFTGTPLSPRTPSPPRFPSSAPVCSTTGTPLFRMSRDMVSTATFFVAPLTMPTHVVGAFPRGAAAVAPTLRTAAASSPARRARMAATDSPSPYETGAPKVVAPEGPVRTPAQLAEAAAARAAAATARVAAARLRVEEERAAAAESPRAKAPGAAASTDEEEANEGDPYLRETMKQYVPPLVTTAFVSGCVALGEAAALVSEVLPPL